MARFLKTSCQLVHTWVRNISKEPTQQTDQKESVALIAWMTRHEHDSDLFVFSSEMYPATLLGLVNSDVIDGSDPCSMQFVYNENIFVAISRAFESLISLHFGRGVNKFDIFMLIRVSTASA